MQRWLVRLAADAGVDVVAATNRWPHTLELVVEHEADAVLLDLATVGRVGVRLIRALRRLAPECEVLAISPFRQIDTTLLEAGASAVSGPSDLRPLAGALGRLRRGTVPT